MKQLNTNFLSRMSKPLFWSIIIFIILILFFSIYGVFIYKEAMASKHTGHSKAEKRVLSETDIKNIDEITTFSGEKTYYVVFGTDQKDNKKLAYVPEKKTKIHIFNADEITSKDKINSQVLNECTDCTKIRIKPGLLNEKPVWEASYVNKKNSYVFEYYSMKDASRLEKFQMRRNFK